VPLKFSANDNSSSSIGRRTSAVSTSQRRSSASSNLSAGSIASSRWSQSAGWSSCHPWYVLPFTRFSDRLA
jgi:hypothetical protein